MLYSYIWYANWKKQYSSASTVPMIWSPCMAAEDGLCLCLVPDKWPYCFKGFISFYAKNLFPNELLKCKSLSVHSTLMKSISFATSLIHILGLESVSILSAQCFLSDLVPTDFLGPPMPPWSPGKGLNVFQSLENHHSFLRNMNTKYPQNLFLPHSYGEICSRKTKLITRESCDVVFQR